MRRNELPPAEPPPADRPGDRWMCGRVSDEAPCWRGPDARGTCPLSDACRPQRTWHGHRKKWAAVALTLAAVMLVIAIQASVAPSVFKPGELSTPHAQILSGKLTSARCASCHPQAATSPGKFLRWGSEGHSDETNAQILKESGITQSDRCMDCHHTTIDRQTAKLAHNLPASTLRTIRVALAADADDSSWHDLLPGPAVDQNNLQCAVCHQEHQGTDGDLLAVSDSKCQTCHHDRFGSFASSHPDWDRWPYGRGGEIAFNHASHAGKHFPATRRGNATAQFQCSDCHARTADNELVRSTSYEVACGSCHDESLQVEAAIGVELLALPTLSEAAAAQASWPEQATGFFDGSIAPMAELLMRGDKGTGSAIRKIPHRDFGRVSDGDQETVDAAVEIALAHRQLLEQISLEGQQAITDRAEAAGITASTASSFIRSIPPQLVEEAHRRWFGHHQDHSSVGRLVPKSASSPNFRLAAQREDDLLLESDSDDLLSDDLLSDSPADGDDLLGSDDLLDGEPLALPTETQRKKPERFDPSRQLPMGGWYRDDLTLAIRYRGGGHADPVLRSTIEMLAQLPPADPVRKRLLDNRAVKACVNCHRSAVDSAGSWHSQPLIGRPADFTKFSHGPHLNVAQLADCNHCHRINLTDTASGSAVGTAQPLLEFGTAAVSGHGSTVGQFAPITRQSCAACHTPHAAGDACVKCHRYHIDQRPAVIAPSTVLSRSANPL